MKQCTVSRKKPVRGVAVEGFGALVWQPVVADRQGTSGRDNLFICLLIGNINGKGHDNPSSYNMKNNVESDLSV